MAGGLNAKQFLRTLKEVTPTREEVKNSRSVLRNFCASNLKQLQEAVVLLKEDEDLSEPKLQAMIKAVQREEEVMKMKADDLRTSANALLGQFWTWTAQQSEKKVTLEETNEQFCQMVNMFDFEAATTATDDCKSRLSSLSLSLALAVTLFVSICLWVKGFSVLLTIL